MRNVFGNRLTYAELIGTGSATAQRQTAWARQAQTLALLASLRLDFSIRFPSVTADLGERKSLVVPSSNFFLLPILCGIRVSSS